MMSLDGKKTRSAPRIDRMGRDFFFLNDDELEKKLTEIIKIEKYRIEQ